MYKDVKENFNQLKNLYRNSSENYFSTPHEYLLNKKSTFNMNIIN